MLKVFQQAHNSKEFLDLIPSSLEVLSDYGRQVIRGEVDVNDLIFTTRVSRDVTEYKVNTLVKSALMQLQSLGINVDPGQNIRYIVRNENSRNYKERVKIAELLKGDETVDVDFYLRQLAKCGESLLVPFGYRIEKLSLIHI